MTPPRPTLRRHALALAACSAWLAAPAQAVVTFDVTDLGGFNPLGAGVGTSIATGINNSGVVVGNFYEGSSGDPSLPWYLPTTVAGLSTWRNLITAGLHNNNPGQPLPAEVVGISNDGMLAGNGTRSDGRVHALSWQLNVNGYADVPLVFDAPLPGSACNVFECDPLRFPYRAVAVNNTHVLLANTLDQSRVLFYPGSLTTVWEPTQAYNGVAAPVALNDAGTRAGSPYTGLNNVGQWVGAASGGSPFLAWQVPNGMGGSTMLQADLNSMLSAGAATSLATVTGINDHGQIVGQGSNGQAVLLTPAGSVSFIFPNGPFGGSGRWDTELGMLPTAALAFVVAPAGGGFVNSSNWVNDPFVELAGRTVKSLTLGTPLSGAGGRPLGIVYDMSLALDLTATDKVVVGSDARLALLAGSQINAAHGLDNQGALLVGDARLTGRLDNQTNAWLAVRDGRFQVNGDLRNGECGAPQGACLGFAGQVQVESQGVLAVSGAVTNVGDVRVDAGGSLRARSFSQAAGQLTVDGTLDTFGGDVVLTGGSLDGKGTINGDTFVGGGPGFAFFRPGHSPGSFTINGQLVIADHGELELQVERLADGSLAWDQVSASNMQFLAGGRVHIVVGAGVAGAQLQTLSFFDCGAGCNFASGTSFVVDGAAGAQVQFSAGGLVLSVPVAQAVPEPASAALLLAGLLLLGQRTRRWRAQAV